MTDTGGPAFPFPPYEYSDGDLNPGNDGMTLRDYFAAKAMQGLLSGFEAGQEHQVLLIPKTAYDMADLMLKARQK